MQNLDLSQIKKVFFIGIGGIGISAIARMMFLQGAEVSGSDMSENEVTRELQNLGIKIVTGQDVNLIPQDVDLIVYTIALQYYDPVLFEKVKNLGIAYKSYPQMLNIVTQDKYTIAVSGTHGKTTTTAMIGKLLIDSKKDPSVIVGSLLKEYKSNLIVGKSEYFVVEACEYERSFLNINPTILVITNMEEDHMDYYKDLNDIQNAFSSLVDQTKSVVVCNPNEEVLKETLMNKNIKVIDYTLYLDKVPKLLVPGIHNRMNAACALAIADFLSINEEITQKSLSGFTGTWRRLEKIAEKDGVVIYDDYAHHPTEVRASLQALRETYPKNRIWVVFQPHLYSRTKALFDDFVNCFDLADFVYLLPIYFAREEKDPSISSILLAGEISKHKEEVYGFDSFSEVLEAIQEKGVKEGDIFVTMGAGEAYKIVKDLFLIK